ncbi:PREDICTED: uncharacterized protein LOC104774197, partial [Camelina sativa]|uniref:Uncharacterized protein LOC104774197 n=1 Tax=Camelina sativa TaxID=90675 RepID=A0ABM0Y8F2_CAMSA
VASGSLPVKERLAHRGVRCVDTCPRCGLAVETINHALFECVRSLLVWELSPIQLSSTGFPFGSVYSNLDFLYSKTFSNSGGPSIGYRLPWILWTIWKDRNNRVFQGIEAEPIDILNQALNDKLYWEEAKSGPETYVVSQPSLEGRDSSIRCQVDGSWKGTDSLEGLGWWFGNDDRTVLMGARSLRRSPSPLHTEFEALIWAMESLRSAGIDCSNFESDSSELVAMVQAPDDWPAFSYLLEDFQALRSSFSTFTLTKIPRTSNVRADCLARSSRSLVSELCFVNSFPPNWATNSGITF